MRTLTEIDCCSCGIVWGVPTGWHDKKRETGATFYCPNGHGQSYTESGFDKMRRERDRLKQEIAQVKDEAATAWRTADAYHKETLHERRRVGQAKGQITKLKQRAQAGVCPCCNRQFVNLQRHMATKHDGFAAEPIVLEAAE